MFERLHLRSLWWPRLVMVIAALAIAWSSAQILWLLLAGPTLPEPPAPDPREFPATAVSANEVPLSQWHLFGQSSGGLDLAQLAAVAPETALRLFLKGTLNLDAPDGGIAIVADEQGNEQAYRVGERLPGDAELIGIYAGRVLLRRAGVEEGLSLLTDANAAPGPAGGGAAPRRSMPAAANSGAQPVPTFVSPQMNFGAPSLESVRDGTRTDIAELARQVNVIPVMENGRFAGVRLSVGRDSDLLARSGLRTSDVITAVNGIPLDVQRQSELLATLRQSQQFTVTIRRDGQSMDVPVGL